jgi:hypothetical protein
VEEIVQGDYWSAVTVPVLNAVGELEEEGADRFSLAVIAERSGVDEAKVSLLVDRLTREGNAWLSGAFPRGGNGKLVTVRIDGLGPKGMQAVRGFPGVATLLLTLQQLAANPHLTEDQRGVVQRAIALLRDLPGEITGAAVIEAVRLLVEQVNLPHLPM